MHSNKRHLSQIGSAYNGFTLVNKVDIQELQCVLREIIHEATGAKVMQIENDDPENFFCLSFRTLPYNSNGIAHILEHTVLCGSKKFPVKDPFFAMNRRSLNTFMNALTGADFTCYPAASQVHKDFYNLLEVYLDSVFHPILSPYSFMQEGHRLEFSDPNNPKTPLEIKGIVFNEMKGALASPTTRLSEELNRALFPDITYGYNSGGNPLEIPDLTYEELRNFHQVYYHPSRCLFFFYGNMPIEPHLDFIATHTLNHAHKLPPLPSIPLQQRFITPVRKECYYPIALGEAPYDKTLIGFAWLTCSIQEQLEVIALCILEIILMDNDASPLKLALLKSGLCKQAQSFIDIELNEIPWGIILKGCLVEHASALENIIKETLSQVCSEGIPLPLIDNALHQLEFHRSEISGDGTPFGLSLFMRSALLKQHGIDPTVGLCIHSIFDKIRQTLLVNPNYFSELIRKYFLENPHFVRIVMKADPHLGEKEAQKERELIERLRESLSPNEVTTILEQTKELSFFQQSQEKENNEILPKVTLKDVPPLARDYPLVQENFQNLSFFHHHAFTNNIVYANASFHIPNLLEDDLFFLRLLTLLIGQVGSGQRSYQETLNVIQENTGGFGAEINLNVSAHDYGHFFPTFHIKGKSLSHKTPKLFSLISDTLTSTKIDDAERLKEILMTHYTAVESRINQNALKYAINLAASGLSTASKMIQDLYGLNYFWKLRDLVLHFDSRQEEVFVRLTDLLKKIVSSSLLDLVVCGTRCEIDKIKSHGFYGLENITVNQRELLPKWQGDFTLSPIPDQGRVIASSVAFIAKALPSVVYKHKQAPILSVAAHLLENKTLHTKIREQGGSYGAGAANNSLFGHFYFYSYRDPNICSTFEAFEESMNELLSGHFDERDIEEAKLVIIQDLDIPIAPGSRADVAYAWHCEGISLDMRQSYRQRVLGATKKEIIAAVDEILKPHMEKAPQVVFADRAQLEKANKTYAEKGKPLLIIESV